MSEIDSEIFIKVSHLDGEQKSAVLNYIRNLKGKRNNRRKRKGAMRQIQDALNSLD